MATFRTRGRLPHWESDQAIYFVTFRLADSLPKSVLRLFELQRKDIVASAAANGRELSDFEHKRLEKLFSEEIESKLDAGSGHCYLRQPVIADAVAEALQHFNLSRYRLYAWCLMPNHVHVLFRLVGGHALADVVHSWKSYSAKKVNRLLGRSGDSGSASITIIWCGARRSFIGSLIMF